MQIAKTKAFQQQKIWVSSYLFSWYSHLNFLGIWFNIWKEVQQIQIFSLFSSADIIALFICFFPPSVGVCKMYEEHLKRMNPNSPSITYDISQLFDFIDDLADLSCLV